MVRPVGSWILQSNNVVAVAESLDKPTQWAIGFFFPDLELSKEVHCYSQLEWTKA